MNLLSKKVAIVTGASSGIGLAAARLFAEQGAALVLVARTETALRQAVQDIVHSGGRAIAVPGDVADDTTHSRAVQAAVSQYGRLDVAFNNAGTLGEMGPLASLAEAGWRRCLDVNLTASFLAAKHQLPVLEETGAGSLIFTSTFVGHVLGFPGMAAYGAAKAGVIGLMRNAAVEYASRGVRVNAILPGGVDTPMGLEGAGSPEGLESVRNLHAMKRIGAASEIASAALYLASDMSSFMTGATLMVDGGVTITRT